MSIQQDRTKVKSLTCNIRINGEADKLVQQKIIDKLNDKYKDHFFIEEIEHTNEFCLKEFWISKMTQEVNKILKPT